MNPYNIFIMSPCCETRRKPRNTTMRIFRKHNRMQACADTFFEYQDHIHHAINRPLFRAATS
jgi:hypothetical protein